MRRIALLAALAIAACATTPNAPPAGTISALDELPLQTLARGQCGLVLWSSGANPHRIVMTFSDPAVARVQRAGHMLELPRVTGSGEAVHGMFPTQTYRGAGISLAISISAQTRGVDGGVVIPAAVVEYTDEKGWSSVIPAAGLISCQS